MVPGASGWNTVFFLFPMGLISYASGYNIIQDIISIIT